MTASNGAKPGDKIKLKCRFKSGTHVELDVLDISPGGCLVDRKRWAAESGDRVLVMLPGLSFQPANIVWIEDELAGIAFEQTLHEAVLTHLQAAVSAKAA